MTDAGDDVNSTHVTNSIGAELEPHDREALARCVSMMLADPEWREVIADKLKNRPWLETAKACCFSLQCDHLRLKPWQAPPCWQSDPEARALAGRLREAGLSIFEPSPVEALARVEQRPRR